MTEKLIEIKDLEISFGEGHKKFVAVKNANFFINKGETFSLVGESGSGKTTIGRAIIGLNETSAGDILYQGEKINGKISREKSRELIRKIQMIFQDPAASLNERATVDYIISEGLYNFKLFENEEDRQAKVRAILKEVGLLAEHLTRFPHEFSGGQRQRIGIARALVMHPELVIADEPISALDVSVQNTICELLAKLQREKQLTYLFICHDLALVNSFSHKIAVMYLGNIVEMLDNTKYELSADALHPYTKALIKSVFTSNTKIIEPLEGDIPSPIDLPKGCPFQSRCAIAQEICSSEAPVLKQIKVGHQAACHLI